MGLSCCGGVKSVHFCASFRYISPILLLKFAQNCPRFPTRLVTDAQVRQAARNRMAQVDGSKGAKIRAPVSVSRGAKAIVGCRGSQCVRVAMQREMSMAKPVWSWPPLSR